MENKDLIFDFFVIFSKTEYSLKMCGFHNGEGEAQANWDKFANSLNASFDKTANQELQKSIDYLLKHPPQKQRVSAGQLQWQESQPTNIQEIKLLLIYLRRVRNNLFHGGKYIGNVLENPPRTKKLIESSIKILRYCISISPEVKKAFEGNTT